MTEGRTLKSECPSGVELAQKWAEIGLSTQPADRLRAEAAIQGLYAEAGLPRPVVIWKSDPRNGVKAASAMVTARHLVAPFRSNTPSSEDARHDLQYLSGLGEAHARILTGLRMRLFGRPAPARRVNLSPLSPTLLMRPRSLSPQAVRHWNPTQTEELYEVLDRRQQEALSWQVLRQAASEEVRNLRAVYSWRESLSEAEWRAIGQAMQSCFMGSLCITVEPLLDWADSAGGRSAGLQSDPWREVARSMGLFWTLPGVCVATDRPCAIHLDEQGRLHNPDGKAIEYRSGWGLYCWHGTVVPAWLITDHERLTAWDIDTQRNVELRRLMIERYGQENYLLNSRAQEIHRDDFGILYRKELRGDEPLVMVKVVNSTPEPDGSFKDYFLRVPPTMRTARAAVAWTFGKAIGEYDPDQES